MQDQCSAFDHWLHGAAETGNEAVCPEDLVAHVTVCPRCRGRLLLLLGAQGRALPPPGEHSCAATEAQLPMVVDYEHAQGVIAAARTFPAVWWATATCAGCASVYNELHEVAGLALLERPALPSERVHSQIKLRVPTALVRRFAGVGSQLGVAWGAAHSDLMISEEEHDEHRVQLYLRRKHAGQVTLVVRTEPPARGIASLNVAHEVFYLQLDTEGSAIFSDMAENLFSLSSDLFVTLDTFF